MATKRQEKEIEVVDLPKGDRTVVLRVRFFTNVPGTGRGQIRPKHIWAGGIVELEANPAHGLAANAETHARFRTLAGIPLAIEKVLVAHKLRVHPAGAMTRYLERTK